ALIWSTGTAAAGKENHISAPIQLNDETDVEGDRDLHIFGDINEGAVDRNPSDSFTETLGSSINSLLANGAKLYIHGNINTVRLSGSGDTTSIVNDRIFGLNDTSGQLLPLPNPVPANASRQATVDMSGHFTGNGLVQIGSPQESARVPLGTVI